MGIFSGIFEPPEPPEPPAMPEVWHNTGTTRIRIGTDGSAIELRRAALSDMPPLTPVGMLHMRLFNDVGIHNPFQDLHCVPLGPRVIVLAAIRDDYVVIEDDATLFPSDKLITSLRLLM